MKEYIGQAGGRYTYIDDMLNLQELSLAFSQIFAGCDNFIISGCEVNGNSISSGYVYINGKIRYFNGSSVTSFPQYLYESNRVENVPYVGGADKVGRHIYGCSIANTVPNVVDPITKAIPSFIVVDATGGITLKDAFLGKYGLLLNPISRTQKINSSVEVNGELIALDKILSKGTIELLNDNGLLQITPSSDHVLFDIASKGFSYKTKVFADGNVRFYIGDKEVCHIKSSRLNFSIPIETSEASISSLRLRDNEISSSTNSLRFNFESNDSFVDTIFGDGKGQTVVSINAEHKILKIGDDLEMVGDSSQAIKIHDKTDSLDKQIQWLNSDGRAVATIGFVSSQMSFECSKPSISIKSLEYVDIAPAIKEGGTLLSEKYVLKTNFDKKIGEKPDRKDVYTKTDSDRTFASKSNGLSQFVTEQNTQEKLRSQIGAIATKDADKKYARLSMLLSDMVKSDSDKDTVCKNIGAVREGVFQPLIRDTGWVHAVDNLYVRQIGDIICFKGFVRNWGSDAHRFSLPNQISSPRQRTVLGDGFNRWHFSSGWWEIVIEANSRDCVLKSDVRGSEVNILATYLN